MNYLLILVLLSVAVLAHEAGHFIAARMMRIPVRIFSIGFGPKLWSWQRRETEFRIAWVPLGGYVMPAVEDEDDYFRLSISKRAVLAAGGPLASVLFPIICFSIFNLVTSGLSLGNLLIKPFGQTFVLTAKMLETLPLLFSHPSQLTGVVGIVVEGGRFVGFNMLRSLQFLSLLSINLAVVNLIPIPVMDGGRLVLCALEKIHPKAIKLQYPLAIAGWIFIIFIMIYVTVLDVGRYL
ncbi:MAG TPA: site-2 protease family protein [Bacillota bacterium]|nr:site-2 protease family protein [Bacillota bacterium]